MLHLIAEKEDYRTAVVLDDVHVATFISLKVNEPGDKKEPVFKHNSKKVTIK